MYTNIDALPLGSLLQVSQGRGVRTQVSKDPGKLVRKLFAKMPPRKDNNAPINR